MNEEERRILERTYKMVEENNRILRAMRRAVVFGRVMHFFYWIIIIGISIAIFYYVQPYLGSLDSAVKAVDQYKSLSQ